jgi:hypothetical protein
MQLHRCVQAGSPLSRKATSEVVAAPAKSSTLEDGQRFISLPHMYALFGPL